jgi:hypothetical protein
MTLVISFTSFAMRTFNETKIGKCVFGVRVLDDFERRNSFVFDEEEQLGRTGALEYLTEVRRF